MARTSAAYGVLEPGDRIAVAMSGGKDSYGLVTLLKKLAVRLPFSIELLAVHVALGQPGYDGAPLVRWLEQSGLSFDIAVRDIYSVVSRHTKRGATPCAVCSRMRRGVLYNWASEHGCNKIALGHHREDTLTTLLMNLFYCGKLRAMPARYETEDSRFTVIRPLIECAEADLRRLAELAEFPIIPCGLCSSQQNHKRKAMAALLDELEKGHPKLRQIMLGALKNVQPAALLDLSLLGTSARGETESED